MKNQLNRFVPIGVLLLCLGMSGSGMADLGVARYDYWLNIPGVAITDLTGNVNYPDNPSGGYNAPSLLGPRNWAETYGGRLTAYLVAPVTGNYTFEICSDDYGELWLSTDDNPAKARMICNVPGYAAIDTYDAYPEQKSAAIGLKAGEIYFVRALQKEGTGDDHLQVAWSYPGQARITIGGNVIAYPNPRLASQPSPENKATGIPAEGVTLSWVDPLEGFVTNPAYDVYLFTDPNNPTKLLENSTSTEVATGPLTHYETTYFWRVDIRDPNNGSPVIRTGEAWRFTTVTPKPFITQQPVTTWVASGADVTLTIMAEVPVTEYPITGYAWFNAADPGTAIAVTQNLALTNVTGDAAYFCQVTNANGTVVSDTAQVIVKRMVAHWPFESNLNDIADSHNGSGKGATAVTYATGVIGQAVQLNGIDQYIEVPYAADLNPASSFSVSAWANINGASVGRYRAVVSNRDDGPQRGFILYAQDSNSWSFWTGPGWNVLTDGAVATDAWTFLAITFEITAKNSDTSVVGTKRLYINGEPAGTATGVTIDLNMAQAFQIGAGANEGASKNFFLQGLVDDVRMYNHTLTAREIAQMYIDVYPDKTICTEILANDLNQDCKVDFADLQLLLASWMDCNLIPDCQ